jgi:hypothetical protein
MENNQPNLAGTVPETVPDHDPFRPEKKSVLPVRKYKVFGLIVVVILFSSLLVTIAFFNQSQTDWRSRAATGQAGLSFHAAGATVSKGQEFNVIILLKTNGNQVTASSLALLYDSKVITPVKLENTDKLLPVVLKEMAVVNSLAKFTLGAFLGKAYSGSGMLATVKFRAVNSGQTQISFSRQSQIAAFGSDQNVLSPASATFTVKVR